MNTSAARSPSEVKTYRVLEAANNYRLLHSWQPSLREIAAITGISTSQVNAHVWQLVALGLVTQEPRRSRTLVVTKAGKEALQ